MCVDGVWPLAWIKLTEAWIVGWLNGCIGEMGGNWVVGLVCVDLCVGLWRGLNSRKRRLSVVVCFVVGWLNGCIGEMGSSLGGWIVCVDAGWASGVD